MTLCAMLLCSIAHSVICTRLFRGKMHSDWFNGIEILECRWQHGEKVGYCYPSGLEKDCKWDICPAGHGRVKVAILEVFNMCQFLIFKLLNYSF